MQKVLYVRAERDSEPNNFAQQIFCRWRLNYVNLFTLNFAYRCFISCFSKKRTLRTCRCVLDEKQILYFFVTKMYIFVNFLQNFCKTLTILGTPTLPIFGHFWHFKYVNLLFFGGFPRFSEILQNFPKNFPKFFSKKNSLGKFRPHAEKTSAPLAHFFVISTKISLFFEIFSNWFTRAREIHRVFFEFFLIKNVKNFLTEHTFFLRAGEITLRLFFMFFL